MNVIFSLRKAILLVAMAAGIVFLQYAHAQSTSTITFPIPELGNCADQATCKTYCSDPTNQKVCVEFGTKHNLIKKAAAVEEKKPFSGTGPGGCTDQNSCRMYCADTAHAEECLSFAEKNGLMKKEDAERARQFLKQTGPGGCKGEECRTYCTEKSHLEACLKHAEENNLIPKIEVERVRKMLKATEAGGPRGCKGEECRAYCTTTEHQKECYEFAKKEGFTRPEDDRSFEAGQKLKQATEQATGGPGGCKGEDGCRKYCADPARVEECIAFAASHGGITEDQAKQKIREFSKQQQGEAGTLKAPAQLEKEAQMRLEKYKILQNQFLETKSSDASSAEQKLREMKKILNTETQEPSACTSAEECAKRAIKTLPGIMREEDKRMFEESQKKNPSTAPKVPVKTNVNMKLINTKGCASPEECAKLLNSVMPVKMQNQEKTISPERQGVLDSTTKPVPATEQKIEPTQSALPLRMFLGGVVNFFTSVLQ